jgi:hypothetical protein
LRKDFQHQESEKAGGDGARRPRPHLAVPQPLGTWAIQGRPSYGLSSEVSRGLRGGV